jgi:hypothetical protein
VSPHIQRGVWVVKWGRAASAGSRARVGFRSLARFLSDESEATSGPAPITSPKSKPSGGPCIDLTARAMSLHNRNRAAARRYLERHARLIREIYSDE